MLCPHAAILALVLLCMDKILCWHISVCTEPSKLFCFVAPVYLFFSFSPFLAAAMQTVMLLFGSIGAVLHCIAFHYMHRKGAMLLK